MAKIRWVTTIKSTKYKLKTVKVKAQLDSVSLVMFATRPRPLLAGPLLAGPHYAVHATCLLNLPNCLHAMHAMHTLSSHVVYLAVAIVIISSFAS